MKFKLQDGTIVDAVKDCGCTHHTVPHWVHMDKVHASMNSDLLEKGNVAGHVAESRVRLDAKKREMSLRGIVEIIHEAEDVI